MTACIITSLQFCQDYCVFFSYVFSWLIVVVVRTGTTIKTFRVIVVILQLFFPRVILCHIVHTYKHTSTQHCFWGGTQCIYRTITVLLRLVVGRKEWCPPSNARLVNRWVHRRVFLSFFRNKEVYAWWNCVVKDIFFYNKKSPNIFFLPFLNLNCNSTCMLWSLWTYDNL